MIKQISIQNYKSVVKTSIPLKTFNVIIGANGCGKSNILEAIAMAAASSSGKLDYEYFANRGIRVVDPRLMLPAFDGVEEKEIIISVSVDETERNKSVFRLVFNNDVKPPRWEDRNISFGHFFNLMRDSNVQNIADLRQMLLKTNWPSSTIINFDLKDNSGEVFVVPLCEELARYTIYSLEESILRRADDDSRLFPLGRHGEGLFTYLKSLRGQDNGGAIVNEIVENLEVLDWFDGMEIPRSQLSTESDIKLRDRYFDEAISFFDQRSTNEGFLFLLFYLTLIISEDTPNFFAIENIDSSFNPKLCKEVISRLSLLAKKHGKQIIATTHNPSVLDGLNIQGEDDELLIVRRSIDGYTKVNRVETKGMLNMSLSNAWLEGFIGGLPNNF